MGAIAYLDSSALLKLAIREEETPALEADLAARVGLVTSRIAVVECRRAARRIPHKAVLPSIDDVLEAVYLLDLTAANLEGAAAMDPPVLRSLDAIHLATALSIGDPNLEVITYDERLAEASRAAGLVVVQPGW